MGGEGPLLSAEVVFRPATGGDLTGPITAATLERHRPDPHAAQAVQDHFRLLGFTVGPVAGISCSITASRQHFQAVFGVPLGMERDEQGQITEVSLADGGLELPLDRLPTAIADLVHAITFTPPPDFGPVSYQ